MYQITFYERSIMFQDPKVIRVADMDIEDEMLDEIEKYEQFMDIHLGVIVRGLHGSGLGSTGRYTPHLTIRPSARDIYGLLVAAYLLTETDYNGALRREYEKGNLLISVVPKNVQREPGLQVNGSIPLLSTPITFRQFLHQLSENPGGTVHELSHLQAAR